MEGDKDKKADSLVTDMLNAGVVKPSERLKASIAKKAGQVTESDRQRIEQMLKGLSKYRNLEEPDSGMDKYSLSDGAEKTVKQAVKQEKSPRPHSGGLLDFIDAEMTHQCSNVAAPVVTSPKPGKKIEIKPAPTLNNKTNLEALSSAFQNLTFGSSTASSTVADSKEEINQENLDNSEDDSKDKNGKTKRQRRRKNRGKKQDNLFEGVPVMNADDEDMKPILVYDIEGDEDEILAIEDRPQDISKDQKKGSYSQLLQTMGKGHPSQKASPVKSSVSPKNKRRDYVGAEMMQIATACDSDGVTKRDVILSGRKNEQPKQKQKNKQEKKKGNENDKDRSSSQASSRKSSIDRHETNRGKGKQLIKNKSAGHVKDESQKKRGNPKQTKQADNKGWSQKQSDKVGSKRGNERRVEQQANQVSLEEFDDSPMEMDYFTMATVNIRKQEHKFVIGHQRKHLQEIFLITGVQIDVPPIDSYSETIVLSGLKSQLGPAIALMFSKSQQAQLEVSHSKGARGRDILLSQGRGQQNFQGHQKGQFGQQKGQKNLNKHPAPPLLGRQHSSNSQSSSTEYDLDPYEFKGHNVSAKSSQHQQAYSDGKKGQGRGGLHGPLSQFDLKGPTLYDQYYGGKQQKNKQGGRQIEPEMRQKGKKGNKEEQMGQAAANKSQGKRQRTKKAMFADYLSQEELSAGLKRGTLIEGPIRINPKNFEEAYVPHPDGCSDIVICGLKDRNRALNGDIVAVEILEQGEWKLNKEELENLADTRKPDTSESDEDDSDTNSDIVIECEETIELVPNEASEQDSSKAVSQKEGGQNPEDSAKKNVKRESPSKRFVSVKDAMIAGSKNVKKLFKGDGNADMKKMMIRTGKVVALVERKHSRAATGQLKPFQDKCTDKALFCPNDHRLPRIIIPMKECPDKFLERHEDYSKTLFVARITCWRKDSIFADGQLAKSLGEAGEIEPETEGMLIEYGIDFDDFPQEVLDCLPKQSPWCIPSAEFEYRKDFRSACVFTIDPSTARDLDDALSCEDLGDGRYKVGVHIADVSFFVKENTSLDIAAGMRATSVYLVQKVVPMLPRLLCEELCSLNPDVERLTFSVEWTISEQGEIEDEWFGRSVIKSCVKLAYDHAQGFIEQPEKDWSPEELPPISQPYTVEDIKTRVLNLHKIAQNLRKGRLDSGSLRLDQVKLQYSLNQDTMMPNGCFVYEQKDSNKLVEEFMLLANMAVAHRINSEFPDHAVLRRHPPPQQKMMENLKEQCSALGIHINIDSAGTLQRSLQSFYGNDEYSMARIQVLVALCAKPMQNAKYFCTGCIDDEALYHHYALNVPLYTHFTSPIRRYPDILVHRLLGASLGYCAPPTKAPTQLQKVAEHCNDKKTAAKRVGELSGELFFAVFVKTVGPLEEKGMVMAVFDKSFDVFVVRLGVSKRVYCDKLPLREKSFKKERKVPSLKLVWKEEEGKPEVQQEITIFSVVDCVLQQGDFPLQWVITVKRPSLCVMTMTTELEVPEA